MFCRSFYSVHRCSSMKNLLLAQVIEDAPHFFHEERRLEYLILVQVLAFSFVPSFVMNVQVLVKKLDIRSRSL